MSSKAGEPLTAGPFGCDDLKHTLIDVPRLSQNTTHNSVRYEISLDDVALKDQLIPRREVRPYEKMLDSERLARNFVEVCKLQLSRPSLIVQYREYGLVTEFTMEMMGQEYARVDDVILIGGAVEGQSAKAYVQDGRKLSLERVSIGNADGLEITNLRSRLSQYPLIDLNGSPTRYSEGANGTGREVNAYFDNTPALVRVTMEHEIGLDMQAWNVFISTLHHHTVRLENADGLLDHRIGSLIGFNPRSIKWHKNLLSEIDGVKISAAKPMLEKIYRAYGISPEQSRFLSNSVGPSLLNPKFLKSAK